jgi:hypothetical protein
VSQDWVFPTIEEWTDLWHCFHDAYILALESDLLERSLVVSLELGFPDISSPARVTGKSVKLSLAGVTHSFVYLWRAYPGPTPQHQDGMENELWNKQIGEWIRKGRVESATVTDFQACIADEPAEVLRARGSFASSPVALEIEGTCDPDGGSFRLVIASESVAVALDGAASSMEEVLELGKKGWDDWSRKK